MMMHTSRSRKFAETVLASMEVALMVTPKKERDDCMREVLAGEIEPLLHVIDMLRLERLALAVLDRSMNDEKCYTGHVALLTKDYQKHRARTDEALCAFEALQTGKEN